MGKAIKTLAARALLAGLIALSSALPAAAQALIRDAEIERTLRRISDPIFRAAGLNPSSVNLYIIQNRELNAFVAGGQNIFIHTGLITKLETMPELQAVIAHETGHIIGGHLNRKLDMMRGTATVTGLATILAVAAAAATGSGDAAAAAMAGSQQVMQRNLLANNRAQEAAADQASLRIMTAAGIDASAALKVQDLFRGQEILSMRRADPYAQTHPMSSDRIRYMENGVANQPVMPPPDPDLVYWHKRMQAKFNGFLLHPNTALKRVPRGDTGEFATLTRAIAYHRLPDAAKSMAAIDALIDARPDDAYYHELKGQFLLENGKAAAAVTAYRRALDLAPDTPLIMAGLGRALVALDTRAADTEALGLLETARRKDPGDTVALHNLARAYARTGQMGMASLVTAERYALMTRLRDAHLHATRAAAALPPGSPGARRAQDIITMAERLNSEGRNR
ncbi:M48 family metalloprotease [Oceanomicrobium pacificus]|uniref:M48 family metalloprotease n=1 Tax=Oceanomicrobium pacificus TaxID=2692916 RepID=A0A6B0TMJ8_9RHOB|nr:M48 family metalloprotease [Oceanomicrobium pacificus]MXU65790.1 M48 family metalloprotease [Oceanomicrobium pacificus]